MEPEMEWSTDEVSHSPGAGNLAEAAWTRDNDIAIIQHINNVGSFSALDDELMWKMMENDRVVEGRSAVELKDRFTKHIFCNLAAYTTKAVQNKFAYAKRVYLEKLRINKMDEHQENDATVKQNPSLKLPSRKTPKLEDTHTKRRAYTKTEEMLILHALLNKCEAKESQAHTGNALWKTVAKLEEVLPTGRSWQSLKERFNKHVFLNLENYDLSEEDKKKLYRKIKMQPMTPMNPESDPDQCENDGSDNDGGGDEDDIESVKTEKSLNDSWSEESPDISYHAKEVKFMNLEMPGRSEQKIKPNIAADGMGLNTPLKKLGRDVELDKLGKGYIDWEARESFSKKHAECYKKKGSDLKDDSDDDSTKFIKKTSAKVKESVNTIYKRQSLTASTTKRERSDLPTKTSEQMHKEKRVKEYDFRPSNRMANQEDDVEGALGLNKPFNAVYSHKITAGVVTPKAGSPERTLPAGKHQNNHNPENHDVLAEAKMITVTSRNSSEKMSSPVHCLTRARDDASSVSDEAETKISPREKMAVEFVRNIARQVESPNAEAKNLAEMALMLGFGPEIWAHEVDSERKIVEEVQQASILPR